MMVQCITDSYVSEMNVQMYPYAVNHTNEKIMMLDDSGQVNIPANRLKQNTDLKKTNKQLSFGLVQQPVSGAELGEGIKRKQLKTSEFVKLKMICLPIWKE